MKNRFFKYIIISLSLIGIFGATALTLRSFAPNNSLRNAKIETELPDDSSVDDKIIPIVEEPKEITAKITAVGDILFHDEQLASAYNADTNKYNFIENYEYVGDLIKDADLSLATCETSFAGEEFGYSGFPLFNTPTDALDNLKEVGFDVLSVATNHAIDILDTGFLRTVDAVKERNFSLLGARSNIEDKNYSVTDVNGIKIGLTSYTYETPSKYGQKTLNSIPVPYSISDLINSFNPSFIEDAAVEMEATISNMKADGAEFIIFVMHWGDEYATEASPYQKVLAEKLNSLGVDVIFGSHPHVVQPFEKVKAEGSNKETLVFHSLGNFISNQRFETMGNELSANGALAQLEIAKKDDGSIEVKSYDYIPTWVYKYTDSSNSTKYKILPLRDITLLISSLSLPNDVITTIEESKLSTESIIGEINN